MKLLRCSSKQTTRKHALVALPPAVLRCASPPRAVHKPGHEVRQKTETRAKKRHRDSVMERCRPLDRMPWKKHHGFVFPGFHPPNTCTFSPVIVSIRNVVIVIARRVLKCDRFLMITHTISQDSPCLMSCGRSMCDDCAPKLPNVWPPQR